MTSPSANQQTAVRRGARRNSSAGTRATAFGQRSGFGSVIVPVFEALPADRTHQPFQHNTAMFICAKLLLFPDETSEETGPRDEVLPACSRRQPAPPGRELK